MIRNLRPGQRVTIHYGKRCRVATPYDGRTGVVQSVVNGSFHVGANVLVDRQVVYVSAWHLREVL